MSSVIDYKFCERCKVNNARLEEYNCRTGEEIDNCLVCGDQKYLVLVEENGERKAVSGTKKGFGSIRLMTHEGGGSVELLESPLTKEDINKLKERFSSSDVNLRESSVMVWNEDKSELEVVLGSDIRTIAPYKFNIEQYEQGFEEIKLGEYIEIVLCKLQFNEDNFSFMAKDENKFKIFFEMDKEGLNLIDIEQLFVNRCSNNEEVLSVKKIVNEDDIKDFEIKKFSDLISQEELDKITESVQSFDYNPSEDLPF